jgi:hypothetical protein
MSDTEAEGESYQYSVLSTKPQPRSTVLTQATTEAASTSSHGQNNLVERQISPESTIHPELPRGMVRYSSKEQQISLCCEIGVTDCQ